MHLDIEIPPRLPVMTLRDTVFFPQSILPLHIFEERYRRMLEDVLNSNRLFAVACRAESAEEEDDAEEQPCETATVGVVRASHGNPDGTSNLVLQGVCRVRIRSFSTTDPYPTIEVEPIPAEAIEDPAEIQLLKANIGCILKDEEALSNEVPLEFMEFLESLEDPEAYIDLTAFAICACAKTKQQLLETVELEQRFRLFLDYLTRTRDRLQLHRRLQGSTEDDEIDLN